jgi:hypothetical protein
MMSDEPGRGAESFSLNRRLAVGRRLKEMGVGAEEGVLGAGVCFFESGHELSRIFDVRTLIFLSRVRGSFGRF